KGDDTDVGVPEISKSKINTFLFNEDTVDKVLDYLMTYGQKIEGGDKLGKSIIFAKNHQHAIFIEQRFNKNYPEYKGTFLRVIDNYEDKAQDLLERFCFDKGEEKDPQIAVSVDMMDTGVDAPRVLNLVFFKEVKSYAKYWQMIGRGTRLCPNIFGPGKDKEFFLIFDICANFEFFEENPDGYTPTNSRPLQQLLFEAQLDIIVNIQNNTNATEEDDQVAHKYKLNLFEKVKELDESRFEVRKHLKYVKKYKVESNWEDFTQSDVLEIQQNLSHLVAYTDDKDELAKRFDLLIFQLELAIMQQSRKQVRMIENIQKIGKALHTKRNIPAVANKMNTINAINADEFWQNISLLQLEKTRDELRDLIQFLKDDNKETPIYSDLTDDLPVGGVEEKFIMENYTKLQSYKDRVESFIRKNKNHLVIDKLYKNIPVTPTELEHLEEFLLQEAESKDKLFAEYEEQPLGKFVRRVIGLDIEAAQQHFSKFIQEANLNANQITFIQKIINYLNKNGVLDKTMLTQSPFNDQDDNGIIGIFPEEEKLIKVIQLVDQINLNAGIGN
ncbi:MAG: type I restriction-modification enzyme R subunit C-terminal domain-containing protein, partial [Flavobacterium sp.]